jgi:2'-5' RNA ligase
MDEPTTMRLFVCTFLASADRAFYDATVRGLVDLHGRLLRPIPNQSAHVTYAFIAHLDDERLPVAVEALACAAGRIEPAHVTIDAPEVLFAGREARLIEAPIADGSVQLAHIADRLAAALEAVLPEAPINRSRSPHVTLARFRRGTTRRAAQPVLETLARREAPTLRHARFTDVQLVSSELTAGGPIYTVKASVAFGGPRLEGLEA